MGLCHGFATVEAFLTRFGQLGQLWQFPRRRKWFKIRRSSHIGRVAQLVRAPASHAGGHRFESCRAHHSFQSLTNSRFDLLPIKQGVRIEDDAHTYIFRQLDELGVRRHSASENRGRTITVSKPRGPFEDSCADQGLRLFR